MMNVVNLQAKLASFSELWSPKIVGIMDDYEVMVVRVDGEFVWHSHADTDDFFLVLEGELAIEMRDRTVTLRAGELFIVPKGVEHRPAARNGPVQMLSIERRGTPNTGDARSAAVKQMI